MPRTSVLDEEVEGCRPSPRTGAGGGDGEEKAAPSVEEIIPPSSTTRLRRDPGRGGRGALEEAEGLAVRRRGPYLGHIRTASKEQSRLFGQFGTRRRRGSRKKTGRSKHCAFVEFKHAEVAQVVAKSMNGYLLTRSSSATSCRRRTSTRRRSSRRAGLQAGRLDGARAQWHNAARSPAEHEARSGSCARSSSRGGSRRRRHRVRVWRLRGAAARPATRARRARRGGRKPTPAELAAKKRKAREEVAAGGAAKKRKPALK